VGLCRSRRVFLDCHRSLDYLPDRRFYGLRALGTITGVSFLFHSVGSFTSILLGGFLYDLTGSYTLPFAIAGALLFPAALSAFTIKERKYSARYQAQPAAALGTGD
jgi:hypothetical protein